MTALGYVVGVMVGDGNFNHWKTHYTMRLETTSKTFAEKFKVALEQLISKKVHCWLAPPRTQVINAKKKTYIYLNVRYYRVQTHSKVWFYRLKTLVDQAKSGELPFETWNDIRDFVRGFWDSEGNKGKYQNKSGSIHYWIKFTNKNTSLLKLIQRLLNMAGIGSYMRPSKQYTPYIEVTRKTLIKKFRDIFLSDVESLNSSLGSFLGPSFLPTARSVRPTIPMKGEK